MNLHPSHRAHLERRQVVALRNTDQLFKCRDARRTRRLRHWANLCHKLETKLWPLTAPTPEEAAQFRAEQEGRA